MQAGAKKPGFAKELGWDFVTHDGIISASGKPNCLRSRLSMTSTKQRLDAGLSRTWLAQWRLGAREHIGLRSPVFSVERAFLLYNSRTLLSQMRDRFAILAGNSHYSEWQYFTRTVGPFSCVLHGSTLKPSKFLMRWVCVVHAK